MKRTIIALLAFLPLALSAQNNWAVVNQSSTFMREKPGYEQENGNQALMGELVQVLDSSSYWLQVKSRDYTAWLTDMGVTRISDSAKDAYLKAPKWICTADYTHIYGAPSHSADRLTDFTAGNIVRKADGHRRHGFLPVLLPDGRSGWVPASDVEDMQKWASRSADENAVVEYASRYLGTPYMWGGNSSKYFDCSGFSKLVYMMQGILLPRNASQQAKVGMEVFTAGIDGQVDITALKPGDLLFFGRRATADKPHRITHVAIYMGGGRIIHSSHRVRVSELSDYGREVLVARRIIGHVDTGEGVVSVARSPYWFAQD